MTAQKASPLEQHAGRLRTRMGGAFVGQRAVFRGHDLHADLGEWFAECVETLLDDSGVAPASLAFVASHGQTVYHVDRSQGGIVE